MVPPAAPHHHRLAVEAAHEVGPVALGAETVHRVLRDCGVRELQRERHGRTLEDAGDDESAHHGRRDAADGCGRGQDDETAALVIDVFWLLEVTNQCILVDILPT